MRFDDAPIGEKAMVAAYEELRKAEKELRAYEEKMGYFEME